MDSWWRKTVHNLSFCSNTWNLGLQVISVQEKERMAILWIEWMFNKVHKKKFNEKVQTIHETSSKSGMWPKCTLLFSLTVPLTFSSLLKYNWHIINHKYLIELCYNFDTDTSPFNHLQNQQHEHLHCSQKFPPRASLMGSETEVCMQPGQSAVSNSTRVGVRAAGLKARRAGVEM